MMYVHTGGGSYICVCVSIVTAIVAIAAAAARNVQRFFHQNILWLRSGSHMEGRVVEPAMYLSI